MQFSIMKGTTDNLSKKLEKDIFLAEKTLSAVDGLIIIDSYLTEINDTSNAMIDSIPRWALDALLSESIVWLEYQTQQEVLVKINTKLVEEIRMQTNQAIKFLLEKKWDTIWYRLLITQIAEARIRLWAIHLMQK